MMQSKYLLCIQYRAGVGAKIFCKFGNVGLLWTHLSHCSNCQTVPVTWHTQNHCYALLLYIGVASCGELCTSVLYWCGKL